MRKNLKNLFLSKIFIHNLIFIFNYICLTNCIIEIPLETVKIKGVPKFPNIKLKEPLKYSESKSINKTVLINQGGTKLNDNYLFLAKVKIGSNNQVFNLLLDTGSVIVWVPKKGSSDQYKLDHHFNPGSSSTSFNTGETFDQQYGTGSCSGYYYTDDFKYINDKKFNIKFGVADKTDLSVDGGDGIIGLAHYYEDEAMSFIHMLKKYEVIDSESFSFKFGEDLDTGVSGKLFIGKHEDFLSNETVTAPLVSTFSTIHYWNCKINGISFVNDDYKLETDGIFNMIFDTGTNIIILPLYYLRKMENSLPTIGCNRMKTDNYYQIYCLTDYVVDLKIKINNYLLTIPSEYIFYEVSSSYSYSRIVFGSDYYIIGSPFFLAFHTLFDKENEKLHFYPEKREFVEKDSNVFEIILITLTIIFLIILFGYIVYKFVLWKKAKDEMDNGYPSSNYDYYNKYNQNFL